MERILQIKGTPQSIEQIGLPDLLPIDFYKPYIETLEKIQNEYLSEKTLWQKIKKLIFIISQNLKSKK